MSLRLHECACDADVRQASGPDLGARYKADLQVRRLPSAPAVFHDDPCMPRPDGEALLSSSDSLFYAKAVTLSSPCGNCLSHIGRDVHVLDGREGSDLMGVADLGA